MKKNIFLFFFPIILIGCNYDNGENTPEKFILNEPNTSLREEKQINTVTVENSEVICVAGPIEGGSCLSGISYWTYNTTTHTFRGTCRVYDDKTWYNVTPMTSRLVLAELKNKDFCRIKEGLNFIGYQYTDHTDKNIVNVLDAMPKSKDIVLYRMMVRSYNRDDRIIYVRNEYTKEFNDWMRSLNLQNLPVPIMVHMMKDYYLIN